MTKTQRIYLMRYLKICLSLDSGIKIHHKVCHSVLVCRTIRNYVFLTPCKQFIDNFPCEPSLSLFSLSIAQPLQKVQFLKTIFQSLTLSLSLFGNFLQYRIEISLDFLLSIDGLSSESML